MKEKTTYRNMEQLADFTGDTNNGFPVFMPIYYTYAVSFFRYFDFMLHGSLCRSP
jgi:hypothetical protein